MLILVFSRASFSKNKEATLTVNEAFVYLKKVFKSDRACADFLCYTAGYFNSMLCGRRAVPKKTALYIIDKAKRLKENRGD